MPGTRSYLAVALALALSALSGCATETEPPPRAEPADLPALSEVPAIVPPTVAAPEPPKPPEPIPDLESLRGLNAVEVTALLGAPQFQRIDQPARIWQYRTSGCILDLFLYPSAGGELSVDHLETRRLKSPGDDPQSCFAAMVKAARST